jgi:hypothetical protein
VQKHSSKTNKKPLKNKKLRKKKETNLPKSELQM